MTGAAQSGAAPTGYQTERAVMLDLEIVKQAFFEKVVTLPNPYTNQPDHRFVAWAEKLDGEYGEANIRAIWNPNDRRDRPYNLVLSLASNGKHYPLIDWDSPTKPDAGTPGTGLVGSSQNIWFRSGSGHWHAYCNGYGTDLSMTGQLAEQPLTDDKPNPYAKHVMRQGYASLRPPWMPKGKSMSKQPDAIPEGFLDGLAPSQPDRGSWEELFND
tara:strand:- start:1470 stop:2111 length:642 start_codon:yes stop_codon:yes gene_type:complete